MDKSRTELRERNERLKVEFNEQLLPVGRTGTENDNERQEEQ